MIRVLADDLTGALDTGAEFARAAGRVHAFWHGGLPDALPASAAVDSGTRERSAAQARAGVRSLVPVLTGGGIAYKKVDSLMRGATVAELAACFAAGGWRACVFAPAFPFQGRVTRGGRQWVQRGAGWEAAGPDLVAALQDEGVTAQRGRVGAELAAGINVFDAESDAELEAVASADPAGVLWAGTGGLARALARADAAAPDHLPRPVLGLFGSDQEATFAQLRACGRHWLRLGDGARLDAAARALERGLALLSVALPAGLSRQEAARRIGRALHEAAGALTRPGTLLVAGGETLRFLCVALGATSLELEGRIVPGLPRATLRGGAWDGVTVVSKSGAFGPAHLLRDLLARNGFVVEGSD